jgi:signal transduction histidine kinase
MHVSLDLLTDLLQGQSDTSKWLGHLRQSVGRLGRLFEDLRDFAAPVKLDCSVSGLSGTWRRAWDSLEPEWRNRRATFTDATDNTVLVYLDAFRMEQVFRILFENSLAACADPLEINVASQQVQLRGRPHLVIAVRDNGPGLTWEQHEKVFVPFYTTNPKGTGLGLAIARQIVEAHGGTITAMPDRVAGAEFVIALPRFQPRPRAQVRRQISAPAPAGQE